MNPIGTGLSRRIDERDGNPARGIRPLYKPMNSLAEKGVFRFAKMRVDGQTDERGPHGENLFSFQIAAPKFEVAVLFGQNPAPLFRGV